MAQPWLGMVSSALGMAIALAFISLFSFESFNGPVAFLALCAIPLQVVAVVMWGANPPFVTRLAQPAKGLVLLLVNGVIAMGISVLALRLVGEGISPPGPIPSHFAIMVVPTTFWLSIMWGGWPFAVVIKNPVRAGFAVLAAAYLLTYVVFRVFFDYGFLQGAPVYLASAPHGLFNAVSALVFYVTALAVMFVALCFDLWPLTRVPALMQQPVLGVVWTALAVAGAVVAMGIGVTGMGTDPMVFLTRVTAPFIFGSIIVLNMLQNSLFATRTQPLKGLLNSVAAAVIGYGLYLLYSLTVGGVTGPVASGPPGYDYEIWMANALLSITFPILIFLAAYFAFWPLRRDTQGSGL